MWANPEGLVSLLSWRVIAVAKLLWRYEGSSVPLQRRVRNAYVKYQYGTAAGFPGSLNAVNEIPKEGFQSLGVVFSPAPWAWLQAQCTCTPESLMGMRNMASPTHVGSNSIS